MFIFGTYQDVAFVFLQISFELGEDQSIALDQSIDLMSHMFNELDL